jgi:hypothetical protein
LNKIAHRLMREQDKLVKRFLLLSLIQISGEATLDTLDELATLRKDISRIIENERQEKH